MSSREDNKAAKRLAAEEKKAAKRQAAEDKKAAKVAAKRAKAAEKVAAKEAKRVREDHSCITCIGAKPGRRRLAARNQVGWWAFMSSEWRNVQCCPSRVGCMRRVLDATYLRQRFVVPGSCVSNDRNHKMCMLCALRALQAAKAHKKAEKRARKAGLPPPALAQARNVAGGATPVTGTGKGAAGAASGTMFKLEQPELQGQGKPDKAKAGRRAQNSSQAISFKPQNTDDMLTNPLARARAATTEARLAQQANGAMVAPQVTRLSLVSAFC